MGEIYEIVSSFLGKTFFGSVFPKENGKNYLPISKVPAPYIGGKVPKEKFPFSFSLDRGLTKLTKRHECHDGIFCSSFYDLNDLCHQINMCYFC